MRRLNGAEVWLLLLLACLALGAPEPTVTLHGATWRALQGPEPTVTPAPGPLVTTREVDLWWDGEVLRVQATWTLVSEEPTWQVLPLLGPGLHVDAVQWGGRPAVLVGGDGTLVIGRGVGRQTITFSGVLPGDPTRAPVSLALLGAAAGTVRVHTPSGTVGSLTADGAVRVDDRFVTGARDLRVQVAAPRTAARDRGVLAQATVGLGLTVGEAAIAGQARVAWRLRSGSLDRVGLRVSGVGADLQVAGAQVASWRREGDRVLVTLRESESRRVALDLRWTVPLDGSEASSVPLPSIVPEQAFRSQVAVQIARDGEIEVLPQLDGWEAIGQADLPDFAEGLVEGSPTAAYQAGAAGRAGALSLLRYVPAEQPAVVVDVAATVVAVSAEGRTLTRALLTTRNERAAHLRLTPPPDHRLLAVQVAGQRVRVVPEAGGYRIPLPRSLETLEGHVAFPVEVVLIGEAPAWERSERRALPIFAIDAPIAISRVSVHLPPGYRNRLDVGEASTVADFTEGETLAYGFGLGGQREAEADALWQAALESYMRNDFDEADAAIEELTELGASNENVARLSSNLAVVQGRAADKGDVQSRRVVAQASSRGIEDQREKEEALIEAERELAAGNYAVAAERYDKVESLSKKLKKVEQRESVEQRRTEDLARVQKEIAMSSASEVAKQRAKDAPSTVDAEEEEAPLADELTLDLGEDTASYTFDGDDVEGSFGVEGGEVTGVLGSSSPGILRGGTAGRSAEPDEPAPRSAVERAPQIEVESLQHAPASSRRFENLRSRGRGRDDAAPPPPTDAPMPDAYAEEPLQVQATSGSVVVPVLGQTVRYQRLLLPPSALHTVRIDARTPHPFLRSSP